jgi:hypothetical protein
MKVKGIGEQSFLKLKSLVTVGETKASAVKPPAFSTVILRFR